jgi:hypothetical protein
LEAPWVWVEKSLAPWAVGLLPLFGSSSFILFDLLSAAAPHHEFLTVAAGVAGVFVRPARRRLKKWPNCFTRFDCTRDFMCAVMLVPFLMLVSAPWVPAVMNEVTKGAKLTMALSGVVGLFFILGELLNSEAHPAKIRGRRADD